MPSILVTNDDGISAPGINILAESMRSLGDVYVVGPETEQSAVAHSLTLHRPLRFRPAGHNSYSVNGTPTDCVILALNKLLPEKPDLVISGINHGGNLGDNVTYSGTVAAAMEGTLLGVPSIAVSLVTEYTDDGNISGKKKFFDNAADIARDISGKVLLEGLPDDTLLNINVPVLKDLKGMKITRQGKLVYDNAIQELRDPRQRKCYWIGGGEPQWERHGDSDVEAVYEGYASVTPVHLDLTNYKAMESIRKNWKLPVSGPE